MGRLRGLISIVANYRKRSASFIKKAVISLMAIQHPFDACTGK